MSTDKTKAPNASAVTAPEWVKAELFEELLKEEVKDYKCIIKFSAYPGLKPGENYATLMLRVEIEVALNDGNKRNLSYMLKTAHDSEAYKETMQNFDIFEVERLMFFDIVPELQQMYRDVGQEVEFSAKCFRLKDHTKNVLLEDLKPRGFKNVNRLEGLDLAHMTCALKKLSQWHAASAVRVTTKGEYPNRVMQGYLAPGTENEMEKLFGGMTKPLLTHMNSYKGIDDNFQAIVACAQENMMTELFRLSEKESEDFQVLNHGDCWSNNIMFQYDDAGNVKETFFVDYQIPRYGSPAQDLLYLIISSGGYDIKIKEFDKLIKIYYDELKHSLELLKYSKKIPLLREIHMALHKNGMWGFLTATGSLPVILCDPTDSASFDNLLGESQECKDFKTQMFTNDRYRKHIELILPWLRNRGALEIDV